MNAQEKHIEETFESVPLWKRRLQCIMLSLNILVAGYVAFPSLFAQETSNIIVWDMSGAVGTTMHMAGSHWLAITILSAFGLFFNPLTFSVVFMH